MPEKTIAIIKPDGVLMGHAQAIKDRYCDAGLEVVRLRAVVFTTEQASAFYAEHEGKFFFAGLTLAMTSGCSVVLELEGENAIQIVRGLNGATNPAEAEPGTIRHDFRSAGGPFNTVHGSANQSDYERERVIAFGLLGD